MTIQELVAELQGKLARTQGDLEAASAAARVQLDAAIADLGRQIAAIGGTLGEAGDGLGRIPALVPPPEPSWPVAEPDPVSGYPYRRGFGQAADVLVDLEKWCGRRCGAFAAWTNYPAVLGRDWQGLRGGPAGKYDQMEGVFSPEGAYHLHKAVPLLDRRCLVVWVFPLLPAAEANTRKGGAAAFSNPYVWQRYAGPQRDDWKGYWTDVGARIGVLLNRWPWLVGQLALDLAWEMVGRWYPWSVGPDAANFVVCYRRAVDAIRAGIEITCRGAGDKLMVNFRYAGELDNGGAGWGIEEVYPGDDWCTTIGLSGHSSGDFWSTDAGWRIEMQGDAKRLGFERVLGFAKSRRKKLGQTEWAVVRNADAKETDHPADPKADIAVGRYLDRLRADAALIAWECWLYSSKFALLGGDWPGGKAYLQRMKAAA